MAEHCCCYSVTKLLPTCCDAVNFSMPGFSVVHHYLPEFPSNSCPLTQWCHPIISSSVVLFSSCPQFFPPSGFFSLNLLFTSGGQSIRASASVLPMNIQGWFPLGLTGLISLQSKGLSRASSPAPQFERINSSLLSLLYGLIITSICDYWRNYSFDYTDFCFLICYLGLS